MFFKKTCGVVGSNYVTHLKSLAFQLFLLAFVVALFGLFFYDFGTNVVSAVREEKLMEKAQIILSDLINWGENSENKFLQDVDGFIYGVMNIVSSIPNFTQQMIFAVWFFIIAIYCTYFITGMIHFATAYSINQFMSSNIHSVYTWVFFKGFKENARVTLLSALCCVLLDFAIIMTLTGTYVLFFSAWGVAGVIVTVILFVMLFCARKALFAYLLPIYVNVEFDVRRAFRENNAMVFESFPRLFINTFIFGVASLVCILLSLVLFKVVVASVLILLVTMFSSYLLTCSYFVGYYEFTQKPYFVKKVRLTSSDQQIEDDTEFQQ